MDLQVGDIILERGTGLLSETIEAVEGSCYSHAAGFVGRGLLIEANGFRRTGYQPVSTYEGKADVFRCELTVYDRKKIRELAEREIGGRYDYRLLFVEAIRYWTGIVLPCKEPPHVRICSTLWAGIYRDAGINLCPEIKYPSPADLAKSKLLTKVGPL